MKIHRLVLESFRGIEHADVAFADTGITIIEGDNEVGKTSLAEAIDLVLTVRDDSKKAQVKALQPVGRDVGPEVTIELSSGPYRFVLHKRWLRRAETTLQVLEPAPESHTGREAHDRVTEILAETLDVDLWRALRLEQGTDPGDVAFAGPSLGRALDRSVGGPPGTDREDDLWERIVAERSRYWTPSGRPTVERQNLAERVAAADDAVRSIEAELRQLEAQTDEMARLQVEATDLAAQQRDLEAQERELSERFDAVLGLQRDLERQDVALQALVAERDRWRRAAEARRQLAADLEDRAERLAAATAKLAAGAPERAAVAERQTSAAARHDAAAAARREAEAALHRAQADLEHRRREIELAQFQERLARVDEQRSALEAAEAVLDSVTVDARAVADIEAAHLELVRAEAALAAGATTLRISALAAVTGDDLQLDGEPVELPAGAHHELVLGGEARLLLPGRVAIEVVPGAEAQALQASAAAAREALAERCARHQVADLRAARVAAARRAEAERVVGDASQRIRDDLRDLSVDDLQRKVARHRERLERYAAERPPTPPLPVDFDTAQRVAAVATEGLAAAQAELADAESALAAVVEAARSVEVTNAGLVERATLAGEALEQAEAALAQARAAEGDAAIVAALERVEEAHRLAEEGRVATERSLARLEPDTLRALLANATAARERAAAAASENRDARQRLESVLESRGEQGLAQRADAALTERTRLTLEHERLEARAEAARLLHQTFEARRAEAHARYVAPFTSAIERLGRVVFGDSLRIELDADLRIATRTLHGTTLAFDQLSTGAREQLGIISRLACATIVAGTDGAPVVLDDTLGWTDPQRLAQMAAAIGLAGRTCQIVLLTCTPGRFANVGAATTVRLPVATSPDASRHTA